MLMMGSSSSILVSKNEGLPVGITCLGSAKRHSEKYWEHGKSVFVMNPKINQKQQQEGSLFEMLLGHQWAVMQTVNKSV